jgi:hypothetical protein
VIGEPLRTFPKTYFSSSVIDRAGKILAADGKFLIALPPLDGKQKKN